MATVRLNTIVERSSFDESYFIYDPESGQQGFAPDSPAWFSWLSKRTSFHFTGKHGHFTARQEKKQRGETYWYGYRKVAGQQHKRYLGTTDRLTLAHLEEVADVLQGEALGSMGETEEHNTPPPRPAPEWLTLGSVSVQWEENVLRIRMPQERQMLSRSQTVELLWYLYDHRGEILKKTL